MIGLLLVGSFAHAADAIVLVSQFQARNDAATAIASLLEGYLAQELDDVDRVEVRRIDDMPDFNEGSSRLYLESCPPGEIAGCTYVVGQRGGVDWAVTGTVKSVAAGSKVTVEILDVGSGTVVTSFTAELQNGKDEEFAAGVAKVLAAAVSGQFAERDIREGDEEPDARELSKDEVARQLAELSEELGDVSASISEPNRKIEKPEYTLDDLSEDAEGETKPWDRLKMSPSEYLRYKNSGIPLMEWRERAMGRHGQLLLRANLGLINGPYSSSYYGRYGYADGTTDIVDGYGALWSVSSTGVGVGLGAAYGINPWLDVGVDVGWGSGNYHLDLVQDGGESGLDNVNPYDFNQGNLMITPRATGVFMPTSRVRPLASLGVTLVDPVMAPSRVDGLPPAVPVFEGESQLLGLIDIAGGVELGVSKQVDFVVRAGASVLAFGKTQRQLRQGSVPVMEETSLVKPQAPNGIGGFFLASLQFRALGKDPEPLPYDYED